MALESSKVIVKGIETHGSRKGIAEWVLPAALAPEQMSMKCKVGNLKIFTRMKGYL